MSSCRVKIKYVDNRYFYKNRLQATLAADSLIPIPRNPVWGAHAGRAQHPQLAPFYNGKLGAAEFFFGRLLPASETHFEAAMSGAQALMTLRAEEF